MHLRLKTLALIPLLAAVAACTTLKSPSFSDENGAIRGYDPVAYHLQHAPIKGSPEYSMQYNDALWQFSSAENRSLFEADPERYLPQYGGFCAYAMSKGYVVSIDPEAWHIVDDKLYLNYSLGVRKTWLKDIPGYVAKADGRWQEKITTGNFE